MISDEGNWEDWFPFFDMATIVDICNLALSYLGEGSTVTSIDPPDGSPHAGNCNRWYPHALRACFEDFDWSWATNRIIPARLTSIDNSVYQWKYGFTLPSEMVRLINVKSPSGAPEFPHSFCDYEVEANCTNGSKILLCNAPDPIVTYVKYVDNSSLYPSYFVECVVLRLAAMLVGPIRRTDSATQTAAAILNQYAQALSAAKTLDARASLQERPRFIASQLRARMV